MSYLDSRDLAVKFQLQQRIKRLEHENCTLRRENMALRIALRIALGVALGMFLCLLLATALVIGGAA